MEIPDKVKFLTALEIRECLPEFPIKLDSGFALPVARAYESNIDRVLQSIELLTSLVDAAGEYARQHVFLELEDMKNMGFSRIGHTIERAIEATKERLKIPAERSKDGSGSFRGVWLPLAKQVEIFAENKGEKGIDGIKAIFQAAIVQTWTAFETMAFDLWVAAVNNCPETLADLSGDRDRIESYPDKSKSPQSTANNDKNLKSIPLNAIHELKLHNYNLSSHMGDIHKGKLKWKSLGDIRESYSLAFAWMPNTPCTMKLDAALGDSALSALSAVRNVIVHQCGIADKEYVDDLPRTKAPLAEKGDKLDVNGEMAKSLIVPAVNSSVNLILEVDEWVRKRKAKGSDARE